MVHGVHGTFTQLPRNHQHVGSPSLKQGILNHPGEYTQNNLHMQTLLYMYMYTYV